MVTKEAAEEAANKQQTDFLRHLKMFQDKTNLEKTKTFKEFHKMGKTFINVQDF